MSPLVRLLVSALLCIGIAVLGEPKPVALAVALLGMATALFIYLHDLEHR